MRRGLRAGVGCLFVSFFDLVPQEKAVAENSM